MEENKNDNDQLFNTIYNKLYKELFLYIEIFDNKEIENNNEFYIEMSGKKYSGKNIWNFIKNNSSDRKIINVESNFPQKNNEFPLNIENFRNELKEKIKEEDIFNIFRIACYYNNNIKFDICFDILERHIYLDDLFTMSIYEKKISNLGQLYYFAISLYLFSNDENIHSFYNEKCNDLIKYFFKILNLKINDVCFIKNIETINKINLNFDNNKTIAAYLYSFYKDEYKKEYEKNIKYYFKIIICYIFIHIYSIKIIINFIINFILTPCKISYKKRNINDIENQYIENEEIDVFKFFLCNNKKSNEKNNFIDILNDKTTEQNYFIDIYSDFSQKKLINKYSTILYVILPLIITLISMILYLENIINTLFLTILTFIGFCIEFIREITILYITDSTYEIKNKIINLKTTLLICNIIMLEKDKYVKETDTIYSYELNKLYNELINEKKITIHFD